MEKIVIVDFGGQYTHLIARRIREIGVYSEICNPEDLRITKETVGVIFSGGPQSVNDEDLLTVETNIKKIRVPILGICYGHHLIAKLMGGKVEAGISREFGNTKLHVRAPRSFLFSATKTDQQVWMSHGDSVTGLPEDFLVTASTSATAIAAYQHKSKKIFGVQFHPEVEHSIYGKTILENFVSVCTEKRNWNVQSYYNSIADELKAAAHGKKLYLFISGGVDSLVAFALAAKVLGSENIEALHIDTGFMRLNESEEVMQYLNSLGFKNLKLIDAAEKFVSAVKGIVDPEEKRKIIGKIFVDIIQEQLHGLNARSKKWMLIQGTIYPDTIESGGTKSSGTIKTHHNRVKEIRDLMDQGRVIEPLKELYKDEVRAIGTYLKLPEQLVWRRPFPGPGLAVRLLCSNQTNYVIEKSELATVKKIADLYSLHAEILSVKSVGVQGDYRTYKHPVVLWKDAGKRFSWKELSHCAAEIINSVESVNRVVASTEPLAAIPQLHKSHITNKRIELLQCVDDIVQKMTGDIKEIWQLPVISLPLYDAAGNECFILRPICSTDAMTADVYEMDLQLLKRIIKEIRTIPGTGNIFYDVTTKPPGTIEWE
jgi:GMP synthase (glutamine-hydrolysing)